MVSIKALIFFFKKSKLLFRNYVILKYAQKYFLQKKCKYVLEIQIYLEYYNDYYISFLHKVLFSEKL